MCSSFIRRWIRLREQESSLQIITIFKNTNNKQRQRTRVEIRAVGRKIQSFHTLFCQNFPDRLYTMGAHIIHYYDIARTKSREQNLFQVLDKAFSRCPVLVSCERFLPIQTNGRENRCCSRRIQRCVIHCSLGRGRPSIEAGQIGVDSGV